jgi:ankyrin repeat protein
MHTTSIAETAFTPTTVPRFNFHQRKFRKTVTNLDLLALLPVYSYAGAELQRQVDVTKLLLSFNSPPYVPDGHHLTPLHYASFFGPLELVKPLLTTLIHPDRNLIFKAITHQIIAQPNAHLGFTPLMYACASGHLQIVEYLMQVSQTSMANVLRHNRSALNIAIQYKHVDVVKLLMKFEQQQNKPPRIAAEHHMLQVLKPQDRYLFQLVNYLS